MNCTHVLGLIDAGPLADYPPAHLDAAWRHARECPTCGPALEAATALSADLRALPQPAAPPHLAASVLARIARIEPAALLEEEKAPSPISDSSPWITSLGALVAVIAIVVSMRPGEILQFIATPRLGAMTTALLAPPSTVAAGLALAAGLLVYVAGLFGALTGRDLRRMR